MTVSDGFATTSITLIFIIALCGALLPLHVLNPTPTLLRYGNTFTAGFLVSAALVHLLPSGDRTLLALFPHSYPFSGLFAFLGALTVYILDHAMKPQPTPKSQPLLPSRSPRPATLAYVLAAALSVHSLVEGLTLGATRHEGQFMVLLAAILTHKLFAALSLGASLAGLGDRGKVGALITAVIFACLTPLGALVGGQLGEGEGVSAGLMCVSAGIFLYVGLVELLAEGIKEGGWREVAIFVGAGGGMSLLALWT